MVRCRAEENLKIMFNGDPAIKNCNYEQSIYPKDLGKKTTNEFRQWEQRKYNNSKIGLKGQQGEPRKIS